MAMMKCRECGGPVSSEAETCPHCGVKNPTEEPSGCFKYAIYAMGFVILAGIISAFSGSKESKESKDSPSSPPVPTCKTDWKLCSDNSDLVNNWRDWVGVQIACKMAAEESAKYGEPKFPWPYYFGTYKKGKTYVEQGVALVVEPDAQFMNGFGAMVHSRVECLYNLGDKKVISVQVRPRD
jgi:hypothetical protein